MSGQSSVQSEKTDVDDNRLQINIYFRASILHLLKYYKNWNNTILTDFIIIFCNLYNLLSSFLICKRKP